LSFDVYGTARIVSMADLQANYATARKPPEEHTTGLCIAAVPMVLLLLLLLLLPQVCAVREAVHQQEQQRACWKGGPRGRCVHTRAQQAKWHACGNQGIPGQGNIQR
jgi:hypothetical protein